MAEGRAIEIFNPVDLESRLKEEKEVLEGWFYSESKKFPIKYIDGLPYFEYDVVLKNDRKYRLRVYVNKGYPDKLPDLVVCESPERMPDWSICHKTHTWAPLGGFLKICHWHPAAWKRENMIYQVFEKGKEWLEAYEKYRIDEKLPLDLEQMELNEEEMLRLIALAWWQEVATRIFISTQHLLMTDTERLWAESLIPAVCNALQRVDQDPYFILHQVMKLCIEANPGCIINVSFSIIGDGRWINVDLTPTRFQDLKQG